MKENLKIYIRMLIMFVGIFFLFFIVDKAIDLVNNENEKKNIEEWNWDFEKEIISNFLLNKYPEKGNENFPLLIMKNSSIPEKKPGEKRILVVGDSYVYGYGDTNINYSWWKQLELKIKEAGYSNVNVYAAGSYFYNTKDELEEVLKNDELMDKINPDLVIIGYMYNDPEERNESNDRNLVLDEWEVIKENNEIYKKSPEEYQRLVDEMNVSMDLERLKELGEKVGFYRWDIRPLILLSDGRLERYKEVLKDVDERMKELNIPYFYFLENDKSISFIRKAYKTVFEAMKELDLNAYYDPYLIYEVGDLINSDEDRRFRVSPYEPHPGIAVTSAFANSIFDVLNNDFEFIFHNSVIKDINELEININDTMPFLEVSKIDKNIFEFEYPTTEEKKSLNTSFLYYPIEKDYIKLNLQYPKNVSKIILSGDGLISSEVYVNTIDEKYGFDINNTEQIVTSCKKDTNNSYIVDYKITSVNIVANFKDESNRKLKIEFVE